MSARMSGTVPQNGQIIRCWFPENESPHAPGPKLRPACVVAVNMHMLEDHPKIGLIYGSAQATTAKSGPVLSTHQFELDKGEGGNSLAEQTRFDCSRFVWLPFTVEWFKPDWGQKSTVSVLGIVPETRLVEVRTAVAAGQAKIKPAPKPPVIIAKSPKVGATGKTLTLSKKDLESPKQTPSTE